MSRGVINSVKQRLSHPFSRIESIDQWAVAPEPFMTLTTSAKTGKTAIYRPFKDSLEVNVFGYFLTYANANVDKEDMRELEVRARACSSKFQEKADFFVSRSY